MYHALLALGLLLLAGPASGQTLSLSEPPACRPVSTCDSVLTGAPNRDCPERHRCVCVPSCPECRDCAAGVCVPGVPDPPDDDPSCRERVQKISKAISDLVARGNACRQNSDCVRIDTSTDCLGTCGAFVNRRVDDRIVREIRRLNQRICDDFQRDGCPYATPACQALRPACQQNRCVGVPVLPGPPRPRPEPIGRPRPGDTILDLQRRP